MKLYTKTGDAGQTSLYGGSRLAKNNLRVVAYGEVDELQATLGLAAAHASTLQLGEITEILQIIQQDNFTLSAELATPAGSEPKLVILDSRVSWLEAQIDRYDAELPTLRTFILQGGSLPGASLHLARAVCRRAERAVVALSVAEELRNIPQKYLNRLSDLLFVLARLANYRLGVEELAWHSEGSRE